MSKDASEDASESNLEDVPKPGPVVGGPEPLENGKLKELHNNIRHITQLGMSWFAFFATSNYLTMGWLARPSGASNENITQITQDFIWIVPRVFVLQNILGIAGLCWVLKTVRSMKNQVNILDPKRNEEAPTCESIPHSLYNGIGIFLIAVLISFTWAWFHIMGCRLNIAAWF